MSHTLDAWRWLVSPKARRYLDQLSHVHAIGEAKDSQASLGMFEDEKLFKAWRRELSQDQVSLLAMQARLRGMAARKIDRPDDWIWTEKLLEQASDAASSAWVAAQLPLDRPIFDLCCGAGADSVAFAKQAPISLCSVDIDDIACLLTEHHLDRLASDYRQSQVQRSAAEEISLPTDAWIHVDPDRRSQGKRTTQLAHYHPPVAFLEQCLRTVGGSIKLAPGSEIPSNWHSEVAVEWIGVGKSVRQQRLWWGTTTLDPGTRAVTLLDVPDTSGPIQWTASETELEASFDCIQADWESETWIGDCHPAVRAADMTALIAKQQGAQVIGDRYGYLVASRANPTPWVDWFQVEERFPLDVKKLRRALQARRVGKLEIKKRGVEVDPESLRQSLKLDGDRSATLILVRAGKKRSAILAQRANWSNSAVG